MLLIVLILFTAPINCIVGGKNVTKDDQNYFRHCVYITNTESESFPKIHASGFIFDNKTIITAAHNVAKGAATTFLVRAGSRLYQSGGMLVNVSEVILHPQYDYDDNDIAILKLQNELIFDNTTGPIKIAGPQEEEIYSNFGEKINSTGFGRCEWGNDVCNLRWVDLPIFNFTECKEIYEKALPSDKQNMFCIGNVTMKFFSDGDSGGCISYQPNIDTEKICIGINVYGEESAFQAWPQVGMRLSKYYDWILKPKPTA